MDAIGNLGAHLHVAARTADCYERLVSLRDLETGIPYLVSARNRDTFDDIEASARKFYGIPEAHELRIERIDQDGEDCGNR